MIRLVFLAVLLAPASALAQTADVLTEITGLLTNLRLQKGPVSTVTYDLTKVVKGKSGLHTSDKVLKELTDAGLLHKTDNPVALLPKNRVTIRTTEAAHDAIQKHLNARASEKSPDEAWLPPPGFFRPPGGLGWGIAGDPRKQRADPPSAPKKKR